MYIDSLCSEKDNIVAKVEFCLGANRSHGRDVGVCFDFPLVDILYQIYKAALYDEGGRDDNLDHCLRMYQNEHPAFTYSIDELIELGWIETCFGHMHAVGHSHSVCDENFRSAVETCDDHDIIEFLIWMDEQGCPDSRFCLSCVAVNELLDKWRDICDTIPDLRWFCENHFFAMDGDILWLTPEPGQGIVVALAMARLWDTICADERFTEISKRWFRMAYEIQAPSEVVEYVKSEGEESNRDRLLSEILVAVRCDSKYTTRDNENSRNYNTYRLRTVDNVRLSPDERDKNIPDVHRSFRREMIFLIKDILIWRSEKRWGDSFYLGSILKYYSMYPAKLRGEIRNLVIQYADCDRPELGIVYAPADIVMELILHEETFYYGLMVLFHNMASDWRRKDIAIGYAADVFAKALSMYHDRRQFPSVCDMMDIMLYIVDKMHMERIPNSASNSYHRLFMQMMDVIFGVGYIECQDKELFRYFSKLMRSELSDVSYGRCFYLLCYVTDRLIKVDISEDETASLLVREIYDELKQILTCEGKKSHYINTDCLSDRLCVNVYHDSVEDLQEAEKKQLISLSDYTDDRFDLVYRYRILLIFLIGVCKDARVDDMESDAVFLLIDLLEMVMLDQKLFDYANIAVHDLYDDLKDAFAEVESRGDAFKLFLKRLMSSQLPELVLLAGLCEDDDHISLILQEIEKKNLDILGDEVVPGYGDEYFINCVLERRIGCLYLSVEKHLDDKLEFYKKRGITTNNSHYDVAESQRKRLLYVQGKADELIETGDAFFCAVMKTDSIEKEDDYNQAIAAWRGIVRDNDRRRYSFAGYYNYAYSIYSFLKLLGVDKELDGKHESGVSRNDIENDLRWLLDKTTENVLGSWKKQHQQMFIKLVLEDEVMLKKGIPDAVDFIRDNISFKQGMDEFFSVALDMATVSVDDEDSFKPRLDDEISAFDEEKEIIRCLRAYYVRSLSDKARMLSICKTGDVSDKNWVGAFLLNAVIAGCKTLKASVPYLIATNATDGSRCDGRRIKLFEDHISILFKNCFNMAYQEIFRVNVSDQSKGSTTGHTIGDTKVQSPASLDMIVAYDGERYELFEAFVLSNNRKETYRDHMVKIISNNSNSYSPVFMLVYNFDDPIKTKKNWSAYGKYLKDEFEKEFRQRVDGLSLESKIKRFDESACYIPGFTGDVFGFEIVRQILLLEKKEIEIFHILVDLSNGIAVKTRRGFS